MPRIRHRTGTLVVTSSDISLDILMNGAIRDLDADPALHPVSIASGDTGRLQGVAAREGVRAHAVPIVRDPSPLRDLAALWSILVLLARMRPALVVYGTPKAALLVSIAAFCTRVPVRVQILHGLRLETVHGIARRVMILLERVVVLLSTASVAVSPSLRARCAELGVGRDRVRVLGPGGFVGIDVDRRARLGVDAIAQTVVRADVGVAEGAALVGFVGRIVSDKGIVELVDAVSALRSGGSAVELALIGPDEGIAALPERTRVALGAPWVHRTGSIDDPSGHIAALDLLCLPSHREGLPTVLLEAMATGVPVVATRATGIVDLVEHGVTGLLAPVGDSALLASQIERVLTDQGLRDVIVGGGLDRVRHDFARQAVWRRHRVLYRAVSRAARSARATR